MRRFSKLKKQIENLFEPSLKMEMCCYSYPMYGKNSYGHNSIPRFCVKLDGEVIWDYPKDFDALTLFANEHYMYSNGGISQLIREYIDTPVDELLAKEFKSEQKEYFNWSNEPLCAIHYHLTDLFKAADRRIGKKKLIEWAANKNDNYIDLILKERYVKLLHLL